MIGDRQKKSTVKNANATKTPHTMSRTAVLSFAASVNKNNYTNTWGKSAI